MIDFLHTFNPQPILFQLGWLKVHWYGVFVVLGIVAGLLVALKLAQRQGIKTDEVYNLGFYLIIFSLIGARLYAVFLDLGFYLQNPFEIIAVWRGGLAIHGAIIGGIVTLLIYCWRNRQSFWQLADIIAPAIALGQAFGRWGNYFNQEIFGKPTDLPWGIPIDFINRPMEYLGSQYFQPTFFYESLLDLFNFAVLLILSVRLANKNYELRIKNQGIIFLIYLVNYSLIRIGMEFLRLDPTPDIFGLRLPILVSLIVICVSIGLIVYKISKSYNLKADS